MSDLFAIQYSYLIPLLPLLGAIIAGFFGAKILKGQSHWPIWIGVGASAVISLSLLFQMLQLWHGGATAADLHANKDWYTWIEAGTFKVMAGFYFDSLTAVMLSVVTGIGFLIMVFSAGYMKGEEGYFRFFAYLGLFIFAMTCLVMANNFIMLYLGWEGVGVCSYLLIGYYYERPSAREAAKKAFIVNRIGDFGFGLGIMLIWKVFHTVSFFGDGHSAGALMQAIHPVGEQIAAMKWIPFLLMVGAFGKSAQFPLYVWLPDAMEGPTPVSALIHAATMVTAGVYMIARCSTMFVGNHAAMMTVAGVGAFTAMFAATIALRQFDLKKVWAYSTISQLGYMFAGVAVLAPVAGVFHLVTHAFFKALLFLSSGVVMHAMLGELDMRKLSGLKRVMPITNILMLTGCCTLAGFPFFSGFFSKDDIIGACFNQHQYFVGAVLLLAAFLTAYYTFRLYFQVFQGPLLVPQPKDDHAQQHDDHAHAAAKHDDHGHHSHEPMLMILPLVILAIGALTAGYLNWPKAGLGDFLGTSTSFTQGFHVAQDAGIRVSAEAFGQVGDITEKSAIFTPVMMLSGLICLVGIGLAYLLHLKDRARGEAFAQSMQPLTRILEGKYYVDEFYGMLVNALRWVADRFYDIDRFIIDTIVAIVGYVPQLSGFILKLSTQRGYLQGYAATMLLGIAAILLVIFA